MRNENEKQRKFEPSGCRSVDRNLLMFVVGSRENSAQWGPYQICFGTMRVGSAKTGASFDLPVCMKLDTQTGRTWRFEEVINKDGTLFTVFTQISEYVAQPPSK
jgi:hypothetical protein